MAKTALLPQRWRPPRDVGLRGPFAPNQALAHLDVFPLPGSGAEDVAVDASCAIYTGTREGYLLRVSPDGRSIERIAQTGGAPPGHRSPPRGLARRVRRAPRTSTH